MSEFNKGDAVTVLKPVIHEKIGPHSCRAVDLDENVSGDVIGIMGGWYVVRYCIPFIQTCDCATVHTQNLYLAHELMEESFMEND
ncbi:hypothetical protein AB0I72_27425 [Nocardiopsis sp. NPDC049922]|uniref:hypothetical protein n=1 Tax=Nocardiopsis sp. NPDC049922 TaxID=3155157 RepID=UPI00340B7C6E